MMAPPSDTLGLYFLIFLDLGVYLYSAKKIWKLFILVLYDLKTQNEYINTPDSINPIIIAKIMKAVLQLLYSF